MFWVLILSFLYPRCGSGRRRIGSFSSNYGDGKKAIGLYWQNNSARESRFSVRFFAVVTVVARLPRETF